MKIRYKQIYFRNAFKFCYVAILILASFLSYSQCFNIEQEEPYVTTSLGPIRGDFKISAKGRRFYSFEGVPYAKPPLGDDRFKAPNPAEPWEGVWQARTVYRCLQYRHLPHPVSEDPVVGNEDCLYLNIYTPDLNPSANLDVIVFIHGGSFMFNYGAFQGPHKLLDRDVVYVNLNYRLGPLGFLSTEDDVVPGNNGLKDQITALEWIQEHIRNFGGDQKSVTIAGNSAGGASVHLHYLTEKSRGLFRNGFSQSGTALNPWVLAEKPLEKAERIADLLGCPRLNATTMVDCLKGRPARQIVETVPSFQPWHYNPFSPFAVVVDTWASDPLLKNHPYQLLKTKHVYQVPWVCSHVNSEGLYPAAEFYPNEDQLNDLDGKWNDVLPFLLQYQDTLNAKHWPNVARRIREEYFGNNSVSRETFANLVDLLSDRLYNVDIRKSVGLHAEASSSDVYMYYFAYRGRYSRSDGRSKSTQDFGNGKCSLGIFYEIFKTDRESKVVDRNNYFVGASHGDDASYIFAMKMDTLTNDRDRAMTDLLIDIWISVAKNGKPSIKNWIPAGKESNRIDFLTIESPESVFMSTDESLGNEQFWRDLPFAENENLFVIKDEL